MEIFNQNMSKIFKQKYLKQIIKEKQKTSKIPDFYFKFSETIFNLFLNFANEAKDCCEGLIERIGNMLNNDNNESDSTRDIQNILDKTNIRLINKLNKWESCLERYVYFKRKSVFCGDDLANYRNFL